MRLLKVDPVFDEVRGRGRLRIWMQLRVYRPITHWLVRWDIVKPPRGFHTYGPGTKRRR